MKKLFLLTAFFLFASACLFAQEEEETVNPESERNYVDEQNMTVTEVEELIQSQALIHRLDFVFGVAPILSINTHTKNSEGKFISAPSPIAIPVYIGLAIPNYTAVSFQPSLRFYTTYNLIYEDQVLPAEIENRTGLTLSFLLNLPVVFKLNFQNKYSMSISTGLAGLFRAAVTPANVKDSDAGFTGSVRSDLDYMNSWFYKNMRFLYLSAGIDWLFYYGKTKYGPELAAFLPFSLFTDKSLQGFLISLGIKVEF